MNRRSELCTVQFAVAFPFFLLAISAVPAVSSAGPLDPRGEIHVPLGIPNSLDALKTFVEAEGSFSPGFATYGISFWLYHRNAKKLMAPTRNGIPCVRGLSGIGYLIPWSQWEAGQITVKTEVCQVERAIPAGTIQVVAARAHLTNGGREPAPVFLYAALRPLGPAGGPVKEIAASEIGDALLVEGHPALVAGSRPPEAGVLDRDTIGELALAGKIPRDTKSRSPSGDCSGALRFDLELPPGKTRTLDFICPVLPGRRAAGHRWDGKSNWAQFDLARPHPPEGGVLQPDPGIEYYRGLTGGQIFEEAHAFWKSMAGRVAIRLPDRRWAECFAAIIGHAVMELNEGAPDVAVVNYNVFNRDGVYVANILQKSGNLGLAAEAIGYFLEHPFNGRTQVEADNPGQVLWAMGEHWRFSRDRAWLERVYPSAAKIAAMIRYHRTTPGPHLVKANSLEFGDSLPPDLPDEKPAQRKQVLKPGSCDGHHPEYTEAFDVAGMRAAALLAREAGREEDAARWEELAAELMELYDQKFRENLPAGYGNYSVLWPCRLYPFSSGQAYKQFLKNGATSPGGWRYFALAKAHQGLLAGNRDAGHRTITNHLDHPQMRGWYVFDEGGKSGSGGWGFARTTWKGSVAMPHGWAIAEMWLLLRDSIAFEDGERLHLLAGVPPEWFRRGEGMAVKDFPTYFGACSFDYRLVEGGATFSLSGEARPPKGFILELPLFLEARITAGGQEISRLVGGGCLLPADTKKVRLQWRE